ncbi:Spaf_1101 family AAA-like ATPase [Clostridium tagluense]|uniref:Spaf_1101 family AAA-like ATPase n=1 Tax=Clostridium tagluense TaxID=360422 RepID=UPI001CF18BA4|nr:AAA family ATPase [Clostridium tagluense]MCB2297936.1 AAA family ATPase [Clostridium tagluense]
MDINKMILEQYAEIIEKQRTTIFSKVDFHIHTPGSKRDYKVNGIEYENVKLNKLEKIADEKGLYKISGFKELYSGKDELMALLIIHEAYEVKDLNLIIITDHNTIEWYEKIRTAAVIYMTSVTERKKTFMILPGVEITCFSGTHIIGIFDNENYNKIWEYIKVDLQGIDYDNQNLFTFKSEMDVIKVINKTKGIVYIPHLDNNAAKQRIKDILDPLSGMSKSQLLTSKYVHAIGFTNYDKFKQVVKNTLEDKNNQYYRETPLAYLKDSDAHCIEEIGTNIMYIKMDKPCFHSFKFALQDPKVRVTDAISDKNDIPFIRGVVTRGGYLSKSQIDFSYYPFSKDLNCIIGGRGSGKSTLIKCLQSCLTGRTPDNNFRLFMGKFESILIYVYTSSQDYCIYCKPNIAKDGYTGEEINRYGDHEKREITNIENWLKIYKINYNKCVKLDMNKKYKFLNDYYIDYFDQSQILKISQNEEALSEFMKLIVLKTNYKYKYIELEDEVEKECKKAFLYKYIENSKDIKNLEVLLNKIENLKVKIDTIILQIIKLLNLSMENKILIEYQRTNKKELELLDMVLEQYSFNNELSKFEQNRLSRLIEYMSGKYNIFDINIKLIEKEKLFIKEIIDSQKLEGYTVEEVENNRMSFNEYIEIFSRISREALKKIFNNNDIKKFRIKFNVNSHETNASKVIFKNLADLSLGQRAVAILTIITEGMTSLDVKVPLIIDQPEDQLDNKFIYQHFIKTIRGLKEKKQVILVTHNANIPVSGDAENVMCLNSNNENGWLDTYGSLDDNKIQSKIIDILEGGKESFKLRLSKYNM